jgi:hypothetical protein
MRAARRAFCIVRCERQVRCRPCSGRACQHERCTPPSLPHLARAARAGTRLEVSHGVEAHALLTMPRAPMEAGSVNEAGRHVRASDAYAAMHGASATHGTWKHVRRRARARHTRMLARARSSRPSGSRGRALSTRKNHHWRSQVLLARSPPVRVLRRAGALSDGRWARAGATRGAVRGPPRASRHR